jgi:hypothetical protein
VFDSNENTNPERASLILSEALDETDIEEGSSSAAWRAYFFGQTQIYWEKTDEYPATILVLDSYHVSAGRIRCTVNLDALSGRVAALFADDEDAILALADALFYLIGIVDTLTLIDNSLLRRGITLMPEGKTELLKGAYAENIEPLNEALESRRRALAAQLRGSFRRGGSPPRVPVSEQQCALLATEYPLLLEHWRRIRRWRHEHPTNWREHANVELKETPDDLLDRLDGKVPEGSNEDYPGIPAVLALEHAARRAGLPRNAYSYSALKILRRRGQEVK